MNYVAKKTCSCEAAWEVVTEEHTVVDEDGHSIPVELPPSETIQCSECHKSYSVQPRPDES